MIHKHSDKKSPSEFESDFHIPMMILPLKFTKRFSGLLSGVSSRISKLVVGLGYDLRSAGIALSESEFVSAVLLNCLLVFFLFFALMFSLLFFVKGDILNSALLQAAGYSSMIFLLFFFVMLRYPKVLAEKKAELVDKHLLFALKDLRLQITSGVTLYNAMINVSQAGYGHVSLEFEKVTRNVSAGMPVDKALEKMALESKSVYLRKMTWQLINTLKAGASVEGTLAVLIDDLTSEQKDKIKMYSAELNLWILMYMMFAVAVPTLGATLLIILSSFAGFSITKGFFIFFIAMCFVVQIILIGFIKTRRPAVIL